MIILDRLRSFGISFLYAERRKRMEEKQAVQLEYRAAEGIEGAEGTLVIAEREDLPERGPDGRFLQGNTAGRNKLTGAQREALEEIRNLAPKVAAKMSDMLDDDTVPAVAKIKIMDIILDRTYGKAEAAVKVDVEQHISAEAARARLEAIAVKIRAELREEEEGRG